MTFLTALGIGIAYMIIGTLVGALWTYPEDPIDIRDVVSWPIIICICIIVGLATAVANLWQRIKRK